ncbi:50S ribosomal protein L25/general stress protein Ctc [Solimonas soli]|uniref:50S ribosomal protein L25/general stress protein Ctc n=1 Tax=Solimonas soli TaxID=413479 RepID=UPI00048A00B9|nr:50S ribosomal protein L25/general stress protein Ctc [Solimonas soli]
MAKENFVVNAEPRVDQGKGASRRLRREGKVPAIVYGGKDEPTAIAVSDNELFKHLKVEAFYSHLLTLNLDGVSQQVVLKDLQRHPVTGYAIHADFQRVLADKLLHMHVPLHFKGSDVAPGVKTGGGIVEHQLNQVEVECLPKDLPEYIEVDLSGLNVNESVHLSQLQLPAGVTLVQLKHGNDQSVASVHLPRAAVEEEVPAEAAPAAEVPATAQKAPAADAAKKDEKKK